MDFNLTEEQKQYVETVQRFVGREITPRVLNLEKAHAFPFDIIQKAWDLGILNLSIPETVKGYSLDLISTALIIREISYGDSGIATSAMCNDLANAVIAMHGSEEQQRSFLGSLRGAAASGLLLPDGTDGGIRQQRDDDHDPEGNEREVPAQRHRNASSRTPPSPRSLPSLPGSASRPLPLWPASSSPRWPWSRRRRRADSQACREIPLPCGGRIVTGKPEDKLGQRLSNTATVTFEDVTVEEEQIIGDRRLGFQYLTDVLDYARPMVAAIGVGIARRALDLTLTYTRERRQFGERICDLPVARETLVEMWKRTEQAEMALMKAAFLVQEGAPDRGVYASLAKNLAADAAIFCSVQGLHLHGGYGFMTEFEISKLVRDAQIIDIYEGVREVQNMIIGRELV